MPSRPPPSRLPATAGAILAVLTMLATVFGLPATPPAQAQEDRPLLSMTIDDLDSATINGKGPLHVSGTVTNNDDQAWTDVDIYPFLGHTPITSETDLATQAALPDDAAVGDRITEPGDYTTIAAIQPGQTLAWSLDVRRGDLHVTEPGVYWFGVHALVPNDAANEPRADGRARTFLPLVPRLGRSEQPENVALVQPIRRRVIHQPDGRIAMPARWARDLSPDGRLGRLLTFGAGSGDITWLLDPAVLDAVRHLAAGNPPRDLGPTAGGGGPSGSPSSSSSPSASPDDEISGDGSGEELTPQQVADDKAARTAATQWLQQLKSAVSGHEVLTLPYGDPDLSALAAHDTRLYAIARERAKAVLADLGIRDAVPTAAPVSGYLDQGAVDLLKDRPLTLVSDAMIRGHAPAAVLMDGHRLVTTSSGAAKGGPSPGDQLAPVSLRQRIASQAALRLGTRRPLVVVLPDQWNPVDGAPGFVSGLEAEPWLTLTTVDAATSGRPSRSLADRRLLYPDSELAAQVSGSVLERVRELTTAGNTLQGVLSHNDTLADEVLDEALTSTSYAARGGLGEAALHSKLAIDDLLDKVSIEAPNGVTLGGSNGGFSVTVANDLDQPVSVRLRVTSDPGIKVVVPGDLPVPAHSRSTVTLTAHATTNGVHTVHLALTDPRDVPLGNGTEVPIRSSEVSTIIWWFIGVGSGLLFVAIGVRLVRRLRASRRVTRAAAVVAGTP